MGNTASSSRKRSSKRRSRGGHTDVATRAKQVVGESVQNLQANIQTQIKHLEEHDHPAAHFLDSVCGAYMDDRDVSRRGRSSSFYSEDYGSEEEDDDRTFSEDETTTTTDYNGKRGSGRDRRRDEPSVGGDTASYIESDYEHQDQKRRSNNKKKPVSNSFESEDSFSRAGGTSDKSGIAEEKGKGSTGGTSGKLPKPLASSFAKRCYFTKSGIGSSKQHYEGLTLTGNVVLMLAQAMKLKGCPTICDEDLRRVEQTYPNQFSRLPDELLLSSGWRRISKYCHFSNKPIPDGIPFFHSKPRLHPTGGYYFLLAAAVGMVRPIDVEPLTRDTLVLLETDFPTGCDVAPRVLIEDPEQWTLVDKFCFFSGGPINTDEDVYYQADFDGNQIYMLAFLSPSLTPAELYKLDTGKDTEPGLKSLMAVEEVESVYDLTERDFDDLRLYHLGPCRALPQYILQPTAWTKVLPPNFMQAREAALQRAEEFEIATHGGMMNGSSSPARPQQHNHTVGATHHTGIYAQAQGPQLGMVPQIMDPNMQHMMPQHLNPQQMNVQSPIMPQMQGIQQQHLTAEGFPMHQQMGMMQFPQMPMQQVPMQDNMAMQHHHYTTADDQMLPMDEAAESPSRRMGRIGGMDPPEDEPPSLSKPGESGEGEEAAYYNGQQIQFAQSMQHNMAFGEHHDPMNGYPNDNPVVPTRPGMEYNRDPQMYPSTDQLRAHYQGDETDMHQQMEQVYPTVDNETMEFQEEETDMQQVAEHHYSGVDEQRMQYHDDERDMQQQQQVEQRYSSEDQHGMECQEGEAHMQHGDEQRYTDADQQRMQYHGEEQDQHSYQDEEENAGYYRDEENDARYFQDEPLRDAYDSVPQMRTDDSDDYHQPSLQYSDDKNTGLYTESNEDTSVLNDAVGSPQGQSLSPLKFEYSADQTEEPKPGSNQTSPASQDQTPSEYSHTSSAMRGARELLKRNRQRRLELAARRSQDQSENAKSPPSSKDVMSPQSEVSGATWESGSEVTSVVSAASSAWTDNSGAPERSSRRALILQMAKARMKNHKGTGGSVTGGETPSEFGNADIMGTYSITEEEKKLDGPLEEDQATDIDIAGDLD